MDIVESIENSIIMSNLSLIELNSQRNTIKKIINENEKLTQKLTFSEQLINTFYSFYNKLMYKASQTLDYFNQKTTQVPKYTNSPFTKNKLF